VLNRDAPRILLLELGTRVATEMVRSRKPRKPPVSGKDWWARWRRANGLRGDEPIAIAIEKPIPHFEVFGETNTPLGMEHLRNALVERPTHTAGTGGDAVDEVFDDVCHVRRRVVSILRSG
jgi:hypothetical protein